MLQPKHGISYSETGANVNMNKPCIILGMPKVAGLDDLIREALIHAGYHVISLAHTKAKYPNLAARLYAHWCKFLGETETTKYLKGKSYIQFLQDKLHQKMADYALFISGDIYSPEVLDFVRQHSKNGSVNYQFDGLNRFIAIQSRIQHFDRFYAFDPVDVKKYHVNFATNFYFDHLPIIPNSEHNQNIYFFGSHQDSRAHEIIQFTRSMDQLGYTSDIRVVCKNKKQRLIYAHSPVSTVSQGISFRENIYNAQKARILADFVTSEHIGLSFRVFEALAYQKKLITSNPAVRDYDFYHPDNIFIWSNNPDKITDWIDRPYQIIDQTIQQKYAFSHWIRRVLEIDSS